jgi:tetratricopeptide (TPR) repeat protein
MPKTKQASALRSAQHEAALAEYEKGVRLFQQKDYSKAVLRFQTVLEQYPAELAIGDRARTYLRIAEGAVQERRPVEQTKDPQQAYEVGVFLLNDGQFKEALRHLERAAEHRGAEEGVLVSLASAQVQCGDHAAALATLERVLGLDESARYRVRAMSDFAPLADLPQFREKFLD